MRHRKAGRQFSRNTSHRRAMLRALTGNLIAHERIETTDAKAKELRRVAERLITRARRLGAVAYTPQDKLSGADKARRQAAQSQVGRFLRRFLVIHDGKQSRTVDLIEKVFVDLARRFRDRPGGYTRIVKVGRRRGDNAPMSIIELLGEAEPEAGKASKDAGDKAAKAPQEAEAEPASAGGEDEKAAVEAPQEAEAEPASAGEDEKKAGAKKPAKKAKASAAGEDEKAGGEKPAKKARAKKAKKEEAAPEAEAEPAKGEGG
jgi:large subunit ribosomal protein L17